MKRKDTHPTNERLEARLRQLPEIANDAMKSVTADEFLKQRIERAYLNPNPEPVRRPVYRTLVPAVSLALVLAIGGMLALPALQGADQHGRIITSQAAGTPSDIPHEDATGLGRGNVSVAQSTIPEYRTLWENGSNGNFPLIGLNGSYYRMMTEPESVPAELLGESQGTIAEFTTEPSLSGTDVILSNVAGFGTEVYPIVDMGDTLIAAEVNGTMRLFQRVSFNGNALQGNETLSDTLQIERRIVSMELSDVGVITDRSACELLFQTLLDNAIYESSGSITARQSLLIELDNGLTLQLAVRNDKLAACGTWSCPEFFEAFEDALE